MALSERIQKSMRKRFGIGTKKPTRPPPSAFPYPELTDYYQPQRLTPLERMDESLKIIDQTLSAVSTPTELELELRIGFNKFRDQFDQSRIIKIMRGDDPTSTE